MVENPGVSKAPSPVVDERFRFGRSVARMSLPDVPEGCYGLPVAVARDVLFACCEDGYPSDAEQARRYLRPGHAYRTSRIKIQSSSSSVELADFPGVWFNTVMFIDWPPAVLEEPE